jgi:asparagine synthase (glutamine-hydrolysing)
LRQIAYKYVPERLLQRPKMGFGVPIDDWLRGPLKDWASDLLSPSALGRSNLLDPAPIAIKWDQHQTGRRNWQHFLWNVLMFASWHETYRTERPSHASVREVVRHAGEGR